VRPDEIRDGLIRDQGDAALFTLIANADQSQPAALLGAVIKRPRKSKKLVAAPRLRQAEKFRSRAGLFLCDRRWNSKTSTTTNKNARDIN